MDIRQRHCIIRYQIHQGVGSNDARVWVGPQQLQICKGTYKEEPVLSSELRPNAAALLVNHA